MKKYFLMFKVFKLFDKLIYLAILFEAGEDEMGERVSESMKYLPGRVVVVN